MSRKIVVLVCLLTLGGVMQNAYSQPTLIASPDWINFTGVVGSIVYDTLTLANSIEAEEPIRGSVLEKQGGEYFIVSGEGQFVLKPGESRTVIVAFRPTRPGITRDWFGVSLYRDDGVGVIRFIWMTGFVDGVSSTVEAEESEHNQLSLEVYPTIIYEKRDVSINFNLPKAGRAEMLVISSDGKVITQLIDEDLSVGEHKIIWQADEQLLSGMHYIWLRVNEQIIQQRLLYIK